MLLKDLLDPQGKAVLATLRKKLATLKAEKQELETALAESEHVMVSASKALQLAKSSYRPDKRENKFNRATKPTGGDQLADKMEARRAELKAKSVKHRRVERHRAFVHSGRPVEDLNS